MAPIRGMCGPDLMRARISPSLQKPQLKVKKMVVEGWGAYNYDGSKELRILTGRFEERTYTHTLHSSELECSTSRSLWII